MPSLSVVALLLCWPAQQAKPEPLPPGAIVRMGAMGKSSGHQGSMASLCFSGDGKTIASASDVARLWDIASGKETVVAEGSPPNTNITSIALSADGKMLAAGGMRSGIQLHELPSGNVVRTLTLPGSRSFGPDYVAGMAFAPDGKSLLSILMDQKLVIWDVALGKPLKEFHHVGVRSADWSANGKLLASGGYQDRAVRVWDVTSGRELYQLDGEGNVAMSPDGRRLAYSGTDRKAWLWEIDKTKEPQLLDWKGKFIGSLAFSPDSKTVAVSGEGRIVLYDAADRKQLSEFKAETYGVLAFSPDGKTLAYGKYMSVGLISLPEGKTSELTVIQPGRHQSAVSSVAFSPDGATLASAAHDATVRMWEASSGKELRLLRGHNFWMNDLVFSKDGVMLATAGQDDTLRLWDSKTGNEKFKIKCGDYWPQEMVLSADGRTLTAVGEYGQVARWDATGKVLLKRKGSGHPSESSLSPDGSLMAVSASSFGDRKASFRILEVETGKERASIPATGDHFYPRITQFSPDGKLLAWGCGDHLYLSDVATGEQRMKMESVHAHWPTNAAMAFSPDGSLLASGGDDATVLVHETATGKEVARLKGHKGPITALAFSPDGGRLASGSGDTTILVWDAAAWKK